MDNYILPLDVDNLTLANSGGKGANLARLLRADFPVPRGFVVLVDAYQAFVDSAGLKERIAARLASLPKDNLGPLEAASADIRSWFRAAPIPAGISTALLQAYTLLGNGPVAVRSSATAEDLPEMSFAGQQDTLLNVVGEQALLAAVVDCWSSLWTARAIGYRARNNLSQADLALAVVVQQMLQSEVSGVLFTANPLTGHRGELVIDATFGLGEALVSGQVEPDHYLVTKAAGKLEIAEKTLGAKALSIRSKPAGGVDHIQSDESRRQALSAPQILELAELGRRVEVEFGAPQDIEWALLDGKLSLLQSRPATSLYPLPEGVPPEPLQVWLSFGAVQGMLDPMTVLGRDGILEFVVSVGSFLGFGLTRETQTAFRMAGERLFINLTPFMHNRIGRRIVPAIFNVIEPGSAQSFGDLLNDRRFTPGHLPLNPRTALRLARFVLPTLARFARTLADPDAARERVFSESEKYAARYTAQAESAHSLSEQLAFVRSAMQEVPRFVFRRMIPTFAPGYAMLNALNRLAAGLPDGERKVLEVTRGLPFNVTTEMDLALWDTARAIRADTASADYFADHTAPQLTAATQAGSLPPAAQTAVKGFLDRYGFRGTGEIDGGRIRWREDPTPVIQSLMSYLQIDEARAPDVIFRRGQQEAEAAVDELVEGLRKQHGGWFKAHLFRAVARRVRALAGVRELPKFFAVRIIGLTRQCVLRAGQSLVACGIFEQADDIYFLHMKELYSLEHYQNADGSWNLDGDSPLPLLSVKVRERRQVFEREKLRRQVPRLLLSDGRAYYGGGVVESASSGDVLAGNPVSPGVVEGVVHIVFDPHGTRLEPGEILVCPGTDPAWTPLFLSAGGLVMEVGGLMTHGAVVAREYGIPAVVGVHQVTERLKTGQRVRVDGSQGTVKILEN